ncbi:hypothetical protein V5F38_19930 [Xanthobacter sp. V0B-10]
MGHVQVDHIDRAQSFGHGGADLASVDQAGHRIEQFAPLSRVGRPEKWNA